MRLRASVAAVLAGLAALLGAPSALATYPGAPGLVAFQSDREGNWQIYVMNPDGSGQRRLVDRPATDEFNPSWSSDGTWLAFQTGTTGAFDIARVDADGTGFEVLVGGATDDRWPAVCAEWVVFQRTVAEGVSRIFKVRPDGTGLAPLTSGPGTDVEPTCSPDGERVGFSSTRAGGPPLGYEIGLDGSGPKQLTDVYALDLDYAPDSSAIAYASPDPADGNLEIFTQSLTTGVRTQRTFVTPPDEHRIPAFLPWVGGRVGLARSPQLDGLELAFLVTRRIFGGPAVLDELIVAFLGSLLGSTGICDEGIELLGDAGRSPAGRGDGGEGAPGMNSAPDAQPAATCTQEGSKLEIVLPAGDGRVDVKKDTDGRTQVSVNGAEPRPYDGVDEVVVDPKSGSKVVNVSGVKVTVKASGAFVVLNGLLDLTKHRGWNGVRIVKAKNGKRYLIVLRGGRVLARFEVGDVKQVRKPPTTGGDVALDGTPDRDHFYVAPYHGYPLDRRLPGRSAGGERGTGLLVRFGQEVWKSDWFGRFADRLEVALGAGADSVLVSGGLLRPRTSGTTARIDLGRGNDRATLTAPRVPALVLGGAGNDVVDVRNGVRDVVDGGPGRDRVLADPIDVVRKAEVVSRG